ncbi:CD151 antigen-like isoform X2 [Branchiostoma floridae]|uniref:Tetraspanin n=1 Tax=Branchiostoma floridae TaxID=7739 RepID=A0A9J7L1S7_BRAFL|nr:CD151 antigen-like isoform X2 [Branchiostoma floridae]XP_035674533.1 CD151 antigen-like isoform X2 [Branchiostoma floridae]
MAEYKSAKEKKSNTLGCLKVLLLIFNFLFWCSGAAVLWLGIWILQTKTKYVALLNSATYPACAWILIVAGVIICIIGFVGCCGAIRENKTCLIVYFVFLLIIFLLEIIAGILAYVYQDQLRGELKGGLNSTMIMQYMAKGSEGITRATDVLQQDFRCCGVLNWRDWKANSPYFKTGPAKNMTAPNSCCISPSDGCAARDHPSNIYHVGCLDAIESYIRTYLFIIGAVGISMACLMILGLFCTLCFYHLVDEYYVLSDKEGVH